MTADAIPPLLQAWGVEPKLWTSWAAPIHERNPDLEAVEQVGKPVTEW